MSIGEMQACLAWLYVSEPFRSWFYLDPDAALKSYNLTDEEDGALRKLDRDRLDLFASSLISKRRKGVERAFPVLFALDAAMMRRYYTRFYHLYPARLDQASYLDVVNFGKFVEESLAQAEWVPAYASDLARYERLYYLASIAAVSDGAPADLANVAPTRVCLPTMEVQPVLRNGVQVADFAYDVGEIEDAIRRGHAPAEARTVSGGCSIIFQPNPSGVKMLRINAATKTVLALCDGRRTAAAVVADTEAALGATNLTDAIVETINRLLASNVLGLDREETAQVPVPLRPYSAAVEAESV